MKDRLVARLALVESNEGLTDEIARVLARNNFEIIGVSVRGIDFAASKKQIESFFRTRIVIDSTVNFMDKPNFDHLPTAKEYRLYFPRSPTLF